MSVHSSHCCKEHGCKYGDSDCPVEFGAENQEYMCDYCHEDAGYFDSGAILATYEDLKSKLAKFISARGFPREITSFKSIRDGEAFWINWCALDSGLTGSDFVDVDRFNSWAKNNWLKLK